MAKNALLNRLLIVSIACVSIIFAAALQANADADQPANVQQEKQLKRAKVTLQEKSSIMVGTFAGDKYSIDNTTMVINESGHQIQIQYLLVPCEAELIYEERSGGAGFVHRIKVLSTHHGATNQMKDPPR